jgi:serine/threonine protein kinase
MCLLQTLHSLGIIHRDLKPSNIMIDSTGHLVIVDLGLAKLFDVGVGSGGRLVVPSGLGVEQEAAKNGPYLDKQPVGTPGYMAPEVCCGEYYSFGIDFWSVGVVLFKLFCNTVSNGVPP